MERDERRGEEVDPTQDELAEQLRREVIEALTVEAKVPSRFSVKVRVDRNRHGPHRVPSPTVETVAREGAIWLRIIEPDPDRDDDRPRSSWTFEDGRRVSLEASLRPKNAWDDPIVDPNPFPAGDEG